MFRYDLLCVVCSQSRCPSQVPAAYLEQALDAGLYVASVVGGHVLRRALPAQLLQRHRVALFNVRESNNTYTTSFKSSLLKKNKIVVTQTPNFVLIKVIVDSLNKNRNLFNRKFTFQDQK